MKSMNNINHHGSSVSLKFKKEEKWIKQRIFNQLGKNTEVKRAAC